MRTEQPDTLLFWNEYALKNRRYWDEVIRFAKVAQCHGLLDGVGIQRHIDLRGKLPYSPVLKPVYATECHLKSWVNEKRLTYEIDRIHHLGLKCHISEVSILCYPWQKDVPQQFLDKLMATANKAGVWKLTLWTYPIIQEVE